MTPLTFGNQLKFGPNSYHNVKGRSTFLRTERESTRSSVRTHTTIWEELNNAAPRAQELLPWQVVELGPTTLAAVFSPPFWSRPGVNKLATPLGIDESLAFRAFDKTIIFGHWLSKQRIGIGLRGSLFEKGFYYILVNCFQKSKNLFPKILFRKGGFKVFSHGALPLSSHALRFPHMLYNFPSHANIG